MTETKKLARVDIFREASKKLRQDLERAQNIPHEGEKGRTVENYLKMFLKEHLPKRFDVSSGFILDQQDNVSGQTDVIVYDASNCPVLETFEDNLIIPSDNTAAVIEVKSNLTQKDIEDAADKIAAIKSLGKSKIESLPRPSNISTIGILFAFKSSLKGLNTVLDHYHASIVKHGLGRHIDYIVVLDEWMLGLCTRQPGMERFLLTQSYDAAIGPDGTVLIAGGLELKEKTLVSFYNLLLNHLKLFWPWIPQSTFDFAQPEKKDRIVGKFLTAEIAEEDPTRKKMKIDSLRKMFEQGEAC
jgi:hypothetical protein